MPLFQKKSKSQVSDSEHLTIQLGGYGGLVPTYTAVFGESLEASEASASCIKTNALFCSKVEFSSVRVLKDGDRHHDYPHLDRLLQYSPNPLMCASVFWERTAYFYFTYNNAFIYNERDNTGSIIALWSINPTSVRFDKISTGEILLKFDLNGRSVVMPYSEIIHLAREVTTDAMFGGPANRSIRKVIDLINLNYKGIENAILTSTYIRFLGEYVTKLSESEKRRKAKDFTKNFLNVKDKDPIGIIPTDSAMRLTQLNTAQQKTANYAEVNQWNQAVYKFFGCSEKVISGSATEDEMIAYYERTIEVFFMRAAQEMTRKIFTEREFSAGNRIVYSDKNILYSSTKTRLEIFKAARELGAFTLGTLGDLLGLPVPKGKRDIVVTSQNYNESLQEQGKKINTK